LSCAKDPISTFAELIRSVKLLGVTIDSNLNFNNHISEICKKSIKAAKYFETDWQIFK
jgi:hypothetical protein